MSSPVACSCCIFHVVGEDLLDYCRTRCEPVDRVYECEGRVERPAPAPRPAPRIGADYTPWPGLRIDEIMHDPYSHVETMVHGDLVRIVNPETGHVYGYTIEHDEPRRWPLPDELVGLYSCQRCRRRKRAKNVDICTFAGIELCPQNSPCRHWSNAEAEARKRDEAEKSRSQALAVAIARRRII